MRRALANLIEFSGLSRRQVQRRMLENDCDTDLAARSALLWPACDSKR
jgi:hypothetical protein